MEKERFRFDIGVLEENLLIGKREDETLFWLKTEGENHGITVEGKDVNAVEGGYAWVDKDADTLVIGYPTKDPDALLRLKAEFVEHGDSIEDFTGSVYFVQLSECGLNVPWTEDHPVLMEYTERTDPGRMKKDCWMLDDLTFVRQDSESGELLYIKYSEYTEKEFYEDRFGWVNALRRYHSDMPDKILLDELKNGFVKESHGVAWIDKENDVLVLGPAHDIRPEMRDNFHWDGLFESHNTFSVWDQTVHWVEADSKMKRVPVNWQIHHLAMSYRYMG